MLIRLNRANSSLPLKYARLIIKTVVLSVTEISNPEIDWWCHLSDMGNVSCLLANNVTNIEMEYYYQHTTIIKPCVSSHVLDCKTQSLSRIVFIIKIIFFCQ